MSEYLAQSQAFTATADAIRTKGNTSNTITWDENKGFADAVTDITVPIVQESDINFYDYDGTLVYSYTLQEAQSLTALPPVPEHEGLASDGWNWSLSGIKALTYPMDVGALYNTTNGAIVLHVKLEAERDKSVGIWIGPYNISAGTIDWGDGTAQEAITVSAITQISHTYESLGSYKITINSSTANGIILNSGTANVAAISPSAILRKINNGHNVETGNFAFYACYGLKYVSFCNNHNPSNSEFLLARSLVCAHLAKSNNYYWVRDCNALAITTLGEPCAFLNSGQYRNCRGLTKLRMKPTISWEEGYQAYQNFGIQETSGKINSGTVAGCFQCTSLSSFIIGDGSTGISQQMFYNCISLYRLDFPATITTIGAQAFSGCIRMQVYDFTQHTTVPTLSNSNAFTGIPSDCEIRVPAAMLTEWKAATNWATYADHIVGV